MKRKEVKFRHRVIPFFARIILWPIIKIKYRYKYKKYKDLAKKGPFLVLANHTVPMDPILLGLSFPFHLYYFASEQIFNLGLLSKLLVYAVNPISKAKGTSDINAIRKARKIVKEGGSIGLYPEGNVTYDGKTVKINESVVKLIRLLDIDVIIFTTKGLYLSDPRWSVFRKKGKTSGEISRIIKKEEYEDLSNEELYKLITESLYVNAYEQQEKEPVRFKGKNLAKGLERLVFMDLNTNIPFVTYTDSNELRSYISDFKLVYDEYGFLTNEKNEKTTLVELNQKVIASYHEFYKKCENNLLFSETAKLDITTNVRKNNKGNITIDLNKNSLVLKYKDIVEEIKYDDITSIVIQGKRKIIINYQDKRYLITFNLDSSPYKYLLTYQFYKGDKENDTTSIQQFGL